MNFHNTKPETFFQQMTQTFSHQIKAPVYYQGQLQFYHQYQDSTFKSTLRLLSFHQIVTILKRQLFKLI